MHVQALPGKPYDGHTLKTVIPAIEAQLGVTLERIIADAGYKGHNAPPSHHNIPGGMQIRTKRTPEVTNRRTIA
jgi:hypothetical protein